MPIKIIFECADDLLGVVIAKSNFLIDFEKIKKLTSISRGKNTKMKSTKNTSAKRVRDEGLDKFYTIPSIARTCINSVNTLFDINNWDLIIEPSAGNGNFFNEINSSKKIGIDIMPEGNCGILKQNYFSYDPTGSLILKEPKILVIGNPPFGYGNSLAVQFFNHSAKFASVIAFIIPKTFRRVSIQNKLSLSFHCIHDEEIPSKPCSFTPPMRVKCCFQIWERRAEQSQRVKVIQPTKHEDWDFVRKGPRDVNDQPTPPLNCDFALRAYGGKCGELTIVIGKEQISKLEGAQNWHFIHSKIDLIELIRRFKSLDDSMSKNTARQNSLGKGDLVELYSSRFSRDDNDLAAAKKKQKESP